MNEPDDLWGGEFWASETESAAVALLKRQASLLASKTNGTVQGIVKQRVIDGTVWATLYARVPALNNYEFKLLAIAFSLSASDPKFSSPLDAFDTKGEKEQILDLEGFRAWLGKTLGSDAVHSVIGNLVRYGKGVTAEAS